MLTNIVLLTPDGKYYPVNIEDEEQLEVEVREHAVGTKIEIDQKFYTISKQIKTFNESSNPYEEVYMIVLLV